MRSFQLTRARALRIGATAATVLALVPGSFVPARAAIDAYLVFDDGSIVGDAPGNGIEVMSFSWGAAQSGTQSSGGGGGAGKVRFSDLTITKHVDKASPKLFEACASGKHFPKLRLVKGGTTTTFDDVIIASDRKAGGENAMTETLTLSYARIETATPNTVIEHDVKLAPMTPPPKKP